MNPNCDHAMQVEEEAAQTGESSVARNPRVINMLRGGILYVKIVKSMQETEDGIPARASQVCLPFLPSPVKVSYLPDLNV